MAVKFEAAYLRPLDFKRPDTGAAQETYARYVTGGAPPKADYYKLQDYIFHYIAAAAGRMGMPVHIHTGFGCGGYFELSGADPLLLEDVLNDPTLRATKFVLLHGGRGRSRNLLPHC